MLDGVASRGASVPDAELVKNRAQMRVDGSAAEKERLGDLVVGHSPRHQPQHLDLSRRQVLEAGRSRRPAFRQVDTRTALVSSGVLYSSSNHQRTEMSLTPTQLQVVREVNVTGVTVYA